MKSKEIEQQESIDRMTEYELQRQVKNLTSANELLAEGVMYHGNALLKLTRVLVYINNNLKLTDKQRSKIQEILNDEK